MAGVAESVGKNVSTIRPGDRVIGWCIWGGMAEKVVAKAANCIPIPDQMPFDEASALILTYGTSYYALRNRANLSPGETLLVLGAAGGVGLAAVELGKALQARVVAAADGVLTTAGMTLELSAGFREASVLPDAGSRMPISVGAVGPTDARWGSLRISAFTSSPLVSPMRGLRHAPALWPSLSSFSRP